MSDRPDPALLRRLRAELDEERAFQLEVLDEHGAEPYGEAVKDLGVGNEGFADSAQATEERNEVLAQIDNARTRLGQIDVALARMDDGTYGTCATCEAEISEARLEARPLSVHCVDCAEARSTR